jgi:hypothetical protein
MPSEKYFNYLRASESGGNDQDQSRTSSAKGRYQFTNGTRDHIISAYPQLGLTKENFYTPESQEKAIRALTAENENYLKSKGIPTTDLNVHMAHFLGAGGARDFINAHDKDPNTLAVNVVHPQSVAANHEVFYHKNNGKVDLNSPRTVGEIYQMYGKRFGEGAASPSQTYQAPTPYNPAVRQGWTASAEPAAPAAATDKPATPGQTTPPGPATFNPMGMSRNALSGGPGGSSSLTPGPATDKEGKAKEGEPLFTPYPWQNISSYYVPQLPMKVGGRARAHKVPVLPSHLAKDKHFSKVWEGLHTDPQSVSHEDLLKAYQKISGSDENPAPAVAAQQAQSTLEQGPPAYASGGVVQETEPGAKSKTAVGYIRSDTGGTADKLSFNVVQDSYVIPADIVSGLGHGNSDAGARIIAERFKGRLSARTQGTVPVKLSGGEYVIPPHVVKRVGKGNIERGIDHFEDFIKTVRAKTILDLHHKKKPIR